MTLGNATSLPHQPLCTNKHKQLFTAVAFRHIDFDDTSVMFGWCHRGCGDPNDIGGMVSSASRLHGPSTAWDGPRLCQCAQQLLSHVGGEMALENLMRSRHQSERQQALLQQQSSNPSESPPARQEIELEGGYVASSCGEQLDDWFVRHESTGRCHICPTGRSVSTCRRFSNVLRDNIVNLEMLS
jgi:hypothetical protein